MTLAGEDDGVAGAGQTDGPGNGFRAIQDDPVRARTPGPAQAPLDLPRDGQRILARRIVGGEDGVVAQSGHDLADEGAFGLVPLAGAAEDRDKPSRSTRARRPEEGLP